LNRDQVVAALEYAKPYPKKRRPYLPRRISVTTLLGMGRGAEMRKRIDPLRAADALAARDALEETCKTRLVSIDSAIAAGWARLLGEKDKHRDNMALAATVRAFIGLFW
jgi:hypothetical protein